LVFNCDTDDLEGSFGSIRFDKPLYSQRSRWAWGASVAWAEGIARPAGTIGESLCAGGRPALIDFSATPEIDGIPYEYRSDVILGSFSVTRSYGFRLKKDITLGLEAQRLAYNEPSLAAYGPDVRRRFRRLIPTSDTRMSPFVQLHSYDYRFKRVIDFETLALQEDYLLGHDVWLRVYPAAEELGSTRTLLGLSSGVGYTFPLGDGLWRNYAASRIELSKKAKNIDGDDIPASDAQLRVGSRFVTPRTGAGRVVLDGYVQHRYPNYLNPSTVLGGTGRLRGYQESAFIGPDVVVSNLEFRSRPVQILSVQLGGVVFWDAGDAFNGFDQLDLKHGVGFGLRFLAPQIDRAVFRIDAGFPVDPSIPGAATTVIAQFDQAFPVPSLQTLVP
jgi:hypothetical protein